MAKEAEPSMISQRYFEIGKNSLIDNGRSKILYSRGPKSFTQDLALLFGSIGVTLTGTAVGGLSGVGLGLGITEIATGRRFSQPLGPESSLFVGIPLMMMGGIVIGSIVAGQYWNRWLENQGLLRISQRRLNTT